MHPCSLRTCKPLKAKGELAKAPVGGWRYVARNELSDATVQWGLTGRQIRGTLGLSGAGRGGGPAFMDWPSRRSGTATRRITHSEIPHHPTTPDLTL